MSASLSAVNGDSLSGHEGHHKGGEHGPSNRCCGVKRPALWNGRTGRIVMRATEIEKDVAIAINIPVGVDVPITSACPLVMIFPKRISRGHTLAIRIGKCVNSTNTIEKRTDPHNNGARFLASS